MVNFLYPLWLLGLIISPLLWWRQHKQRHTAPLIAAHLQRGPQQRRHNSVPWLALGWALSMIALAGPNWRQTEIPVTQSAAARVIVMDMSLAMLGQDIAPNRYTQAIFKVMDLLPLLADGYTGLVSYAADGYTVSPLTHDSATIRTHLPNLSPQIMPLQGKNAANGVKQAITLLSQAGYREGDIILVTSGISEKEQTAIATQLSGNGWRFSSLAIATEQGTPIYDLEGRLLSDNQGNTVVSRVTPSRLQQLSRETGGLYQAYRSDNTDIQRLSTRLMQQHDRTNTELSTERKATQVINDGYWLIWPIMLILLMAFRKGVIWIVPVCLLLQPESATASVLDGVWKNNDVQAHELYQQQQYDEAASRFNDPHWRGSAYYQAGDYTAAVDAYSQVGDHSADYNLANAYAQLGELEQAERLYRDVLERDPNHTSAANNLALLEQLKQQQQQQQQQQDDNRSSNEQEGDPSDSHSSNENGEPSNQPSNESNESNGTPEDTLDPSTDEANNPDNAPASQPEPPAPNDMESAPSSAQEEDSEVETDSEAAGMEQQDTEQADDEQGDDTPQSMVESGRVEQANPVLNKLNQIPDDRTRLLKNQMLIQARERELPRQATTEW
ncbi:tetratricopeptide repeat protein [Thaumasiovibrio sp. DFM-14]|uniref:vWA domain-containing protein n=1 Tax=Thaumasiovibrio sp. DFM-14 TaxID=3384792 RepID=UPI0039A3CE88